MSGLKQVNETSISQAIPLLVRTILSQRNWRAARLAEHLSVHPDLVRRWVRGERQPRLDDLLELARLGNVSLDDLFGLSKATSQDLLSPGELEQMAELVGASVIRRLGSVFSGNVSVSPQVTAQLDARNALDRLIDKGRTSSTRLRRLA
jgi:transcriptional regulator with XRE-family HTH domain